MSKLAQLAEEALRPYDGRLTGSDMDLVWHGVMGMIERFYDRDAGALDLLGVEHEYRYVDSAGVEQKGFIDLHGETDSKSPEGRAWFIADWKSSDAQWVGQKRDRQQQSKQPWDYAQALVYLGLIPRDFGTIQMQYRCWSWQTGTATVIPVAIRAEGLAAHEEEAARWSRVREGLVEEFSMYAWPKNDGGCRKFGPRYPCRRESVCWAVGPAGTNKPPLPQEALDRAARWPLSYSSRETLKRCPELYRAEQVEKALGQRVDDEDRASLMGSSWHEALAAVWNTLKE